MRMFKVISLFFFIFCASNVIADATNAKKLLQYNYDMNGRLNQTCIQFVDCILYSYDKSGNLLTKGKTRPVSMPNAGFEDGLTPSIGSYAGNGSISIDSLNYSTGENSLKVNVSSNSDSWVYQTHNFDKGISGRKFTVSAQISTSNLSGTVHLYIYWSDASGNWIWSNRSVSNSLSGNNNWTKLSATAEAPFGATAVTVMIVANSGIGSYWIDNINCKEEPSTVISFDNPSFEQGLDGSVGYNAGSGNISVDTTVSNTGTKSIKSVSSPTNESWIYETHNFGVDISGRKFTVSAYIKTLNLTGLVNLYTYWLNSSGNWIWSNLEVSSQLTGSNDWTKLSATSIAPYGARSLTIMIVSSSGSGSYWVDSIEGYEKRSSPVTFVNPSFEQELIGSVGYYAGTGTINVDSTIFNTGTRSIKLVPATSNDSWVFEVHNFGETITGRTFSVSAYVKTANLVGGVHLRIYWQDVMGNWISNNITVSTTLNSNNNWAKLTTTAAAPAGAVAVAPIIVASQGNGAIWIDSFECFEN